MKTQSSASNRKTHHNNTGSRRSPQKRGSGKRKKVSHRKRNIIITLLAITGLIVVAGVFATPILAQRAAEKARIYIPRDCSKEMLTDSLTKYFGPEYSKAVMKLVDVSGRDLKTRFGSYVIEKGTPAIKAQRLLTHGAQTPLKVTINGFRNFDEMIERVASKFSFTDEGLKKAASDPSILSGYGLTPESRMALWVDDTYEFYWTDTPEHVISKIGNNYNRIWTEENRKKAEALGRTPAEVVILASIAAEETNFIDERGRVGRLYNNRLQKGMKLQSDPTIRFALNDFTIKRIGGSMLKTPSPYNTYLHAGLPPGPIRTTHTATVQSILDSSPSDELYMCAKEDFSGYHNFTDNYKEHLANAERYRKALDERGIKL